MGEESNLSVDKNNNNDNNSDKNGSNVGERNRTAELNERIEEDDVTEDEDEDYDFNPLMKDNFSEEELSSSLSSEIDGVENDAVVVDSVNCSRSNNDVVVSSSDDAVERLSSDRDGLECLENDTKVGDGDREGNEGLVSEGENVRGDHNENGGISGGTDVESPVKVSAVDLDNDEEDAICKRTRARYSLASFTLDELETFLQETDEDDDIQNVDEEEEYRKFLAAVLKDEDEGNENGNDDDEDNDADFEIEIEEALESDVDDCVITSKDNDVFIRSSRRPETRQNRRQKSDDQNKKKSKGKEMTQLRPLLPVMPSASVPCVGGPYSTHETSRFPRSFHDHLVKGFVPHQIGQLYSLIYEHVQLLIQIYSLCVLEPSRQHIASQLRGLLSELLHKRDLVLAWRSKPYPNYCFVPPYCHSTGSNETRSCPPAVVSAASAQGNGNQGCLWLPSVGGPVLSILDVAPLKLVGKYFEDVSNAVREHQRRCVESPDVYMERQPLFPRPSPPSPESNQNVSQGDVRTPPDGSSVSPNMKVPKKTLAATLVENTKKQSVALVPRQIAKVAQPFYSLFNPALFPHKPPSSAVAKRVLFTDAEDELLAMGMMEYNNDWKAIKQRFLPCKSEHQIFVRAKNRCSSKAPENPIKAVRKMKTSPLTDEEKARIHEGLKTFKFDWMAIWKFIVPYRDPNLLGRQWRIANGTQKSYKADAIKKEKRRTYESNRRKIKAAAMENSPTESEKEDDPTDYSGGRNEIGENCAEKDNEAYLHEAFLADWRPSSSGSHIHQVAAAPEGSCLMQSFQSSVSCSHSPSKSILKPVVSEAHLHSHKTRKRSVPNLVKLAPELPPVKLPSAVRVIPQALLRTSHLLQSADGAASGAGRQNIVGDPSARSCSSNLEKSTQGTVKIVNHAPSSMSSQRCEVVNNGCPTKEGSHELDPQMHPLLFQTLEDGHFPYYPSSSRIPTFSFFPVQNQMNVNLLQNPSHASPISATSKSFRSKETVPNSSNLDFHPLLQRPSDAVNSEAICPIDPMLSTDLELSRDGFMGNEFVNLAGATTHRITSTSRPTTHTDAVDLNLDIHLHSALRKRKVPSYEGTEVNLTASSVSTTDFIQGEKGVTGDHGVENCHSGPFFTSAFMQKLGSASSAAVVPNMGGGSDVCTNDDVGDQSLSGIVMEQEELSDSDEELESVEFECEEMTDSEEEGSDNGPIINSQNENQEQADIATSSHGGSEDNICTQKQTPSSAPVDPAEGSARSPWLSLNFHHDSQQSVTGVNTSLLKGVSTPSHSIRSVEREHRAH